MPASLIIAYGLIVTLMIVGLLISRAIYRLTQRNLLCGGVSDADAGNEGSRWGARADPKHHVIDPGIQIGSS